LTVTTASGKRQRFNPRKIYRTSTRAGASRELANQIVEEISSQVYDGIPTRKILDMVLDIMRRHEAQHVASRYSLKRAIMRMGPAGFTFETFLGEVFANYGYEIRLRQRFKGFCAEQEIDIVLKRRGKRSMVEVKYHNAPGIYTGLKEAMYTYSRFLDLREGHEAGLCERFDEAWLATNTRSSLEARRYASCKGIRLLGWKHPRGRGIERMIERKCLYPVTVLDPLDRGIFDALSRANIVMINDLARRTPEAVSEATGIPLVEARDLVERAARIHADVLGRGGAEGVGQVCA